MNNQEPDVLKQSLYAFDIPPELLASLVSKDREVPSSSLSDDPASIRKSSETSESRSETSKGSKSCSLCDVTFNDVVEQRQHVRSDWHSFNTKRKLAGAQAVTEAEFEKLLDELDESISGSGSDSSDSELEIERHATKESNLAALLKKQATLNHKSEDEEQHGFSQKRSKRGSGKPPLLWFGSPRLPSNTSLGIYRALFTTEEQESSSMVETLRKKQLHPISSKAPTAANTSNGVPLPSTLTSPSIFMCMVGGGHFAGMIVSLAPKVNKHAVGVEQRQAMVIAHKTFHRYTTRRKQGGGQSANDAAKGAAHSAGSSLRRYNEVALEQEIRSLLSEWRKLIEACQLIFVRATGSSNRRIIFGPYEDQVLRYNDPRNRTFPFSTRRATQAELMRSFVELTRVKVSQIDEAAVAAAAAAAAVAAEEKEKEKEKARSVSSKTSQANVSKEDSVATLHTTQLQALIRRSKAPALLTYLTNNELSADFPFYPPTSHANHHAPTPLHLAASTNSHAIVTSLLSKAHANPTLPNGEGKPSFDLAGDRVTRDAFRVARNDLGEAAWDWEKAHVPPALTKAEAEERDRVEKVEAEQIESERRKVEEEKLKKTLLPGESNSKKPGSSISKLNRAGGAPAKTAQERREEETRGMTDEMRMRLERERRARAAEARLGKLTATSSGAGAGAAAGGRSGGSR